MQIKPIVDEAADEKKIIKNHVAVAPGQLGELKNGRIWVERLTKAGRSEIAKKSALARWGK